MSWGGVVKARAWNVGKGGSRCGAGGGVGLASPADALSDTFDSGSLIVILSMMSSSMVTIGLSGTSAKAPPGELG
jgi:hypothetical protein